MVEDREIGRIVARLVSADKSFLGVMLQASRNAEQRMLPEDVVTLERWGVFIRMLKTCADRQKKGFTGD